MSDPQAQEAASLAEWLEGVSEAISARRAASLLRSQAARIAELERELARMREPLSDEWIRALCKEGWVFETVKQWVHVIEAAHGITKTGGGV